MDQKVVQRATQEASLEEIVQLAAFDHQLYSQFFFPVTVRNQFPEFSNELWWALESEHRLLNCQMFRGSSKTTNSRLFLSRRIAYGSSRVILFVGISQDKAAESLSWLKNQIERNHVWANTYGLSPGDKWQDIKIEIRHKKLDYSIWVLAFGVTGPIRGINLDDYRPDVIICDDVVNDENAKTMEQREKISDLVFGAIKNSLAPKSEAPNGKLVILQTPIDFEDISTLAKKDPGFYNIARGCWTDETMDSPLEHQESVWPERFSSEDLRNDKRGFIARNKLSVWMREMEVRLVSAENADFRPGWLNYYTDEETPPLHRMVTIISIDPVPKPSEIEIQKGLHGKDYEVIAIVGYYKGGYYLLEYAMNRGHDPSWTIAKFFELVFRWRPLQGVVESIAYQSTLAWLLQQEMKKRGKHIAIHELRDKRSKRDKIVQALNGVASNGMLYCKSNHNEFISQFTNYPNVRHDDVIDAVGMGVGQVGTIDLYDEDYYEEEEDIPLLNHSRGAP